MSRNKYGNGDSNWYEYDWRYNGVDAEYCVDVSYDGREDELPEVLLSMRCKGGKKGLTESGYRRYEKLRDKLIKKCALVYVGLIETREAVYFFFYTESHDVTACIDKIIRHMEDRVSYDCRYDREKDMYRNNLIPDAAKLYTEENREHLRMFEKNGDCMTAARRVNFHVAFPSEPLRILFEEQARLSGYAIGVPEYSPEKETAYGVVVYKMLALNKPDMDDATTRIITIAQKHEGKLMFWDCVLIPVRRSL